MKSQYEMLKLSSSCTKFESNYSSCTDRSSENIYVAAMEALRQKVKTGLKLSLLPKLVEENLVWVSVISLC
jgi:hypothetical protein